MDLLEPGGFSITEVDNSVNQAVIVEDHKEGNPMPVAGFVGELMLRAVPDLLSQGSFLMRLFKCWKILSKSFKTGTTSV